MKIYLLFIALTYIMIFERSLKQHLELIRVHHIRKPDRSATRNPFRNGHVKNLMRHVQYK